MNKTKYGIQLFSIRDLAEISLEKALSKVAEMGYKFVEFGGYFDNSAEEIKGWLEKYALKCFTTHISLNSIRAEFIDETIKFHKIIGCNNLIVPGCDWTSPEKLEEVMTTLKNAEVKLNENGMKLAYHNHSQEFFPDAYGTVFMNEIIDKTSIELEIDTFWVFNAGLDVLEFLENHKDRIKVIHIKDGKATPTMNLIFEKVHDDVIDKSLGEGDAPVKEVINWALKNNVRMVVESEGLEPSGTEEVKRCIDYLNTLE